jgi:hypothetical protein
MGGMPSPATLGYATRGSFELPKPNGWRARTAIWLALSLAALNFLGIGLDAWNYQNLEAAEAGTLTEEQEQPLIFTSLAWLAIYAVTTVVFLVFFFMWLYRAVKNVRITSGDSRSGPGMSVGWWFIPFANLVMPYLVLKDLWERARVTSDAPWVGVFWLLWILSGIVSNVTSRAYNHALDNLDWALAKNMVLLGAAATVASGITYLLLVRIVNSIQAAQEPRSA